jgi:branched-chain amino acid transport system substrate-binding protein
VLLAYRKAYQDKFKEDVSTFGGHAYDAFMILVEAINRAGTDREKVRSAVETMRGFVGTGGVFNYSAADHNGLDLDAFEMLTVKDGRFVPLAK